MNYLLRCLAAKPINSIVITMILLSSISSNVYSHEERVQELREKANQLYQDGRSAFKDDDYVSALKNLYAFQRVYEEQLNEMTNKSLEREVLRQIKISEKNLRDSLTLLTKLQALAYEDSTNGGDITGGKAFESNNGTGLKGVGVKPPSVLSQ